MDCFDNLPCHIYRILDNLPLVFPIQRTDQESAIVYQHGFHVGLRGQYAGVNEDMFRMWII